MHKLTRIASYLRSSRRRLSLWFALLAMFGLLTAGLVQSAVTGVSVSPNPFSPPVSTNTTISYTLSDASLLWTRIYDSGNVLRRQLVTPGSFTTTNKSAGAISDLWNGRNDAAAFVADGNYNYRIDSIYYVSRGGQTSMEIDDVVVDPSNPDIIWASSDSDQRIYKSTNGGSTWSTGFSGVRNPRGLAITADGQTIWVADQGDGRVYRSTNGGSSWTNITWSSPTKPWDLAVTDDGSVVYGVDQSTSKVYRYASGSWNQTASPTGISSPRGVAVHPTNSTIVYVADTSANKVWVSTNSGSSWSQFATQGTGSGQYNSPHDVEVDANGYVWVSDRNYNRVQQYDSSGNWLMTVGGTASGTGNYQFDSNTDSLGIHPVTISGETRLYVADKRNKYVKRYSYENWTSSTDIVIDSVAPTSTITSGSYNFMADALTITGSNFTTIAPAGTDIKSYVNWAKFFWDINGDNATSPDISFVEGDVTSLVITNATTLTLQFTSAKGTAIEATTGYGAAGGADTLDVTAGFIRDQAGNTATTDGVANAPLTIPTIITTLGNGTDPASTTIAPGSAAMMANAFSFQTSSGTDVVSAATVTLASGTSAALSLIEITNAAGSIVYGSAANPASDTPAITLSTNTLTANTTLTQYRIRITPKTHANMPAVPGSSYALTARISAFTSTNSKGVFDAADATITIDNLSPGNVSAATGTSGAAQVILDWTNPADADLHSIIVLRRTVSVVTDTPVEGSTYVVGNTIGSSTVACVAASPATTCNDTGLTNGTAYYYKIYARDSNGNYSVTGVVPTGSPVTPRATTLGNGTDPANSSIAPSGAATMAGAFSFQTSAGSDSISDVTVTLAAGTSAGLSKIEITNTAGSTVYGTVNNPASDTPVIPTTSFTATTTLTEYRIRITPKTHANMPAPPGASYAVTARITDWTGTNGRAGTDSAGTTVTIDNLSTGNVTAATASAGNTLVSLAWTNPADSDKHSIIVLRRTVSVVTDTPTEGTTYTVGNIIGSSTVACVVASPGTSCNDTGRTNGTAYYYKIFVKDTSNNYSATGVVPTGSPSTPALTTLGNGTDPASISLNPGDAATNINGFSFVTSNGTDPISTVTVTFATGTAAGLGLVEITNTAGSTVYGSVSNPASDTPVITLSTNITSTTTSTQYRIRITPKTHANMPVPPGANYAVTARISAWTNTKGQGGSDSAGTTITIDNLSPGNVTAATALSRDQQVPLSWTNPVDADLDSIIVLRRTGSVVTDVPVEGSTYIVGNTIGSSTIACVEDALTENCTDTGLTNGTTYYYKIFTKDSTGNYSATGVVPTGSPVVPAVPADAVPPADTINLNVTSATTNSISLQWTAPGDNGNVGTATSYSVRYSSAPITEGNWASATVASGPPTPLVAGSSQTMTVSGLASGTTYYFALKTADTIPNWSALSNNAIGTTGVSASNATYYWNQSDSTSIATGITTNWSSCGNQPTSTRITRMATSWNCASDRNERSSNGTFFDMYFNTALAQDTTVTGGTFKVQGDDNSSGGFTVSAQLFHVSPSGTQTFIGTAVTGSVGSGATTNLTINISGQSATVPAGNKLALRVATPSGSSSARRVILGSGVASGFGGTLTTTETPTSDSTAPAAVTLSTGALTNTSVVLNWTSPGDDNNTGTASSYDIRYSTSAITAGNWASATQVGGEPTPLVAGTAQSYTVTGLTANTTYYFALKTGDEVPNWSTVSNSPSATTLDPPVGGFTADNVIPAAQISQATNGSGLITITWKGRDNQSQNVTLKTFQYSTNGGTSWSAPTNGDASASLSTNWSNNGGAGYTTATTLAAATAHNFTFNTQHANVTGMNNVDSSNFRIRFKLNDGGVDSVNSATSATFRVDNLKPTATISSAVFDSSTNRMTITGSNFTTIAAAATDIKSYVDWSKFVWDINGDNATTPDITFVVGDVTSLLITNSTTLTLQFTSGKGAAIVATSGYGGAGGADTLDVAAGFSRDFYGNAATTDAVADGPLVTTSVSGTVYYDDQTTNIGAGVTVRLLRNGASAGTAITDDNGSYTLWTNLAAGDAILAYIDDDLSSTGVTASVSGNANLTGFNIFVGHIITRHDNGGSLSNANLSTALGAYSDTDILYSVAAGALTVSGSNTVLHIPASRTFAPGGAVTTPVLQNLGTFSGGSASITVNGDLTSSGTFTASSGTTTVSGNFTNTGTFTHSSGTVLLNGSNQGLSGSSTFFNLTKSVAAEDTLAFDASSTTTINGTATLNGASGQLLNLISGTPGTRWNLNLGASATKAISYVNVTDSDASGSDATKKPILPVNSSNGGNTISWFPALSGIVYTDEGTTNIGAGKTIRMVINGSNAGSAVTDAGGAYSITPNNLVAGDALLVYIDNDATYTGVTATISNGNALTNLHIYADHVITRQDNGGVLSNANMAAALGAYSDADIKFSVTGGNLTVSGATTKLYVPTGHSYTPGGNVTTTDVKVLGTLNAGSGTYTVAGNWDSSAGTVVYSSSTLKLTGAGKTFQTKAAERPWNLTIGNGASAASVSHTAPNWQNVAANDLVIALNSTFTLSGTYYYLPATGAITIATGATLNISGILTRYINDSSSHISTTGTITGTGTFEYDVLTGSTAAPITARTYGVDLSVAGALNAVGVLGGGASLNLGSKNLLLYDANSNNDTYGILDNPGNIPVTAAELFLANPSGSGNGPTFTGKLICRAATYTFSNVTVYSSTTAAPTIDCATGGGTSTWNVSGSVTIDGSRAFKGILTAGASIWNVGGNWSNTGTFTAGTSTINFNGSDQIITGNNTFNNLTKSVATARTLTFAAGSTTTVNGTATLNGASGQLLSLVSDTPATRWNFVLGASATKAISYISVSDSDASGSNAAKKPIDPSNSTDAGNNDSWFTPPVTTLGNGTDPANSSSIPGAAASYAGAFSFQTSYGSDVISAATVTLSAGSSAGLSLVEITDVAGTTVYGSATDPASDTPAITLSSNTLTATSTLTEYRIRITPKSHANMPAPPGASYAVTARISAFTGSNGQSGSDTAGTTVTIDNLSPGNVTASTATPGNAQVSLAWTNPVDADLHSIIVLRRPTSAVADTPVEGTTYVVGNTIGASTVVCVVAVAGASCTDTGLTNGTAYHYKIFTRDSNGNYSATGVVPTGSPATPALTTLGNGTDPANSSIAPGAATTNVGAFSFQTSNGTDVISATTVTLSAGSSGGLSLVEITDVAGTTVYGSVANPGSDAAAITLSTSTLTATNTLTEYRIRITPKSHANMPTPPGSSYAVTARISAFTSTNAQAGSDTAGTTITIDNLSPENVTASSATGGNTQVSLAWTNPGSGDLHSVIVLRRLTSAVADTPEEGTTYSVGNTIGASTVACVVAVAGTSCTDTGLTNSSVYHYRIFTRDSNGNYSATGVVPTGSPTTPAAELLPALNFLKTVAVTSDPINNTTDPKNIPGAEVLYTLRVTNTGAGIVDNNTLIITDPIPANTELFTGNLSGGAPYAFTNGTPTSGLSCTFVSLSNLTDCMDFSNNNGSTWSYVPNGSYDSAVTNIRFIFSGVMSGSTGSGSPYFDLNFRVRLK